MSPEAAMPINSNGPHVAGVGSSEARLCRYLDSSWSVLSSRHTLSTLVVLGAVLAPAPACSAAVGIFVWTDDGRRQAVEFRPYDPQRPTFTLRSGRETRQFDLRDIAAIADSTVLMKPRLPSDSLDEFHLVDGSILSAMFKDMDLDHVRLRTSSGAQETL